MTDVRALTALADVICRAQQNGYVTPMGFAFAIDAAGMLASPETAAELVTLRARNAELEERIERRTNLLRDVQKIAQRRGKEADGRRKHGDALKADVERLTGRVRELDAERHTTNEALADLTVAQRAAGR